MGRASFALAALGVAFPTFAALYSCGSSGGGSNFGSSNGSSNGGASGGASNGGASGGTSSGPNFNNEDGGGSLYSDAGPPLGPVDAGFTAGDCDGGGCAAFPGPGAPPCSSTAPAINIAYPPEGVLLPPNMNVISVQWTPFGPSYQEFEVDFSNTLTNVRVVTKCAAQTVDTESTPTPSGGCELVLDPAMWSAISNVNRGGNPVTITVRGTTDGMCATSSASSVHVSFAQDDLLGAIYYWKSTVSTNGVGGQIWQKDFGNVTAPEVEVSGALNATCNGCHALSRDGKRMVVYSDDDDSDDEYGDVTGKLLDMTQSPPTLIAGGTGKSTGQPPGFSTLSPTAADYLTSNGKPDPTYPNNVFTEWNGQTGAYVTALAVGASTDRPTMPDWSADGNSVVYIVPSTSATWDFGTRNDDAHLFGGSVYTASYTGGVLTGGAAFITSAGENNYYPSFSPDDSLIVFDRAPHDTSLGTTLSACTGTAPQVSCPNDSFSNPAARMMVMQNKSGVTPVDLEAANGSPAASPTSLSNSWPKWSPFLQKYQGDNLLWIAFSSTRDYGLRVRNHQTGMFQCYPPDSVEDPGGTHGKPFDPRCQQPQLWMAAIDITVALQPQLKKILAGASTDPSKPAFWLPFQDITTHNHTPQWTQAVASAPPPDAGACIPSAGNCLTNPGGCCGGLVCQASGTCGQIIPK